MAVHYKFKSTKDFDTLRLDGHCVSVRCLKERLASKLGLAIFDLVVSNAETDEEYLDDDFLVQENTSVLVRRVPGTTLNEPKLETKAGDIAPVMQTVQPDSAKDSWQTGDRSSIQDVHTSDGGNVTSFAEECVCGASGHSVQDCPTKGECSESVHETNVSSTEPDEVLKIDPDQPAQLCALCVCPLKDATPTSKCCGRSYCEKCMRDVLPLRSSCICGAPSTPGDLKPVAVDRDPIQEPVELSAKETEVLNKDEKVLQLYDDTDFEEELDYEGLDDADELDANNEHHNDQAVAERLPVSDGKQASVERETRVSTERVSTERGEEAAPQQQTHNRKRQHVAPPLKPSASHRSGSPCSLRSYAVQCTGYWQASQMMGARLPYGYGGFFPGPFLPFSGRRIPVSRRLPPRSAYNHEARRDPRNEVVHPVRCGRPRSISPGRSKSPIQRRRHPSFSPPRLPAADAAGRGGASWGSPPRSQQRGGSISPRQLNRSRSPALHQPSRSRSPVQRRSQEGYRSRSRSRPAVRVCRASDEQKYARPYGPYALDERQAHLREWDERQVPPYAGDRPRPRPSICGRWPPYYGHSSRTPAAAAAAAAATAYDLPRPVLRPSYDAVQERRTRMEELEDHRRSMREAVLRRARRLREYEDEEDGGGYGYGDGESLRVGVSFGAQGECRRSVTLVKPVLRAHDHLSSPPAASGTKRRVVFLGSPPRPSSSSKRRKPRNASSSGAGGGGGGGGRGGNESRKGQSVFERISFPGARLGSTVSYEDVVQ